MSEAVVHIEGRDKPLSIRINGHNPTFRLGTEKLKAQLLSEITPRYHDFLEIASVIFAADGSVRRGGSTRSDMGSEWRRRFRFRIPVRDPEFWSEHEVSRLLMETASFLTDDDYNFEFVSHGDAGSLEPYLDLDPKGALFPTDDVVLFSGGLDSFSGALDVLSRSEGKVILVSHRSAQKVIPRQVDLGAYLSHRFPDRVKHLHLIARRIGSESADTTQRSRTLLFTAIGAAVGRGFSARRINFFENGIVSHNLPISPQVVGTMATRTTHPLALALLGRLVRLLGDDTMEVRNSFEWMTKTEVVSLIRKNDGGAHAMEMIDKAVSCTSVRDQDKLRTHCGACSQCFDRRFALIGAGLEKFDPPERYATDVLNGSRQSAHSRVIAIEWTRHAIGMAGISDRMLVERFGLEVARIAEGYPDVPIRETVGRMIQLHQRHGENLKAVLRASVDQAMAGSPSLDPNSLVALYLSSGPAQTGGPVTMPSDNAVPTVTIWDIVERDEVPDPDAPLSVSFFNDESEVATIRVVGLCEVRYAPAEVAIRLKPYFDTDRAEGLAPDAHKYQHAWRIWQGQTQDSFRQHVKRCREKIARAFEDLHGEKPANPMLIQSRHGSGYRLDPTINVVARERLSDD